MKQKKILYTYNFFGIFQLTKGTCQLYSIQSAWVSTNPKENLFFNMYTKFHMNPLEFFFYDFFLYGCFNRSSSKIMTEKRLDNTHTIYTQILLLDLFLLFLDPVGLSFCVRGLDSESLALIWSR